MDTPIPPPIPELPRVHTPRQVGLACFIGGPPAAVWLLAENYRLFGERKRRRNTFVLGGLGFLALVGVSCAVATLWPNWNPPSSVASALFAIGVRSLAAKLQGPQLARHFANGGRKASWWNAVGIACLSLIVLLGLYFGLAYCEG